MEYPTKKAFRPSWDDYFMSMAYMAAERSTCDRLRAGAVLVRDKRVIATGYNGAPPNMEHCDDVGHLMHEGHCIRTLHAEENTLLQAARFGLPTEKTTIYSTYSPCYHCLKKLIATGVERIVIAHLYRDQRIFDTCRETKIQLDQYAPDPDWLNYLSKLYAMLPKEQTQEMKTGDAEVK